MGAKFVTSVLYLPFKKENRMCVCSHLKASGLADVKWLACVCDTDE